MSKNTQHTPGPWTVDYPRSGQDVTVEGRSPIHKNPIYITRVYGPGILSTDTETRNANARLIAAAPDLLAALEALNHMGGDERGGYCICPRNDGSAPDRLHSTGCAQARAALAKAKGE